MKHRLYLILIFLFALQEGYCWIYPEHRGMMILAIFKLNPAHRLAFERYWRKNLSPMKIGQNSTGDLNRSFKYKVIAGSRGIVNRSEFAVN